MPAKKIVRPRKYYYESLRSQIKRLDRNKLEARLKAEGVDWQALATPGNDPRETALKGLRQARLLSQEGKIEWNQSAYRVGNLAALFAYARHPFGAKFWLAVDGCLRSQGAKDEFGV